jgi:hypothetical protein
MTKPAFTGGCQCGAVRFHAAALTDSARICHCRMCQKAVGNFFAALVNAPKDKLTWTRGAAARFRSSGEVDRGFCKDCGTPLFCEYLPGNEIGLCIGALDNPQGVQPISQDSVESRMPWFADLPSTRDSGTSEDLDGPARVAAVKASNRQHPDHDTEQWPPLQHVDPK